ncbi:serine-rich adhesin for platelets-like isoform X1 [Maniola hyperantus]|uniref:serine-rich adhesin for platelets-like isoform X1 n=1 Tax=Aphantopus hyperantus TaxID=2795564 RepID=UPI00156818BD|nr:mucin-17-like isoform X1 [Maniola hyperantus]
MRKTSHDGADSNSITSAKDSDTKKSAPSFNKMAKSSIKRKVQNFSHESDDGIIEPLLQTDKEKIEIANRSAKYLLNKSKTESLHEKDNKITDDYDDKCSVRIPVSSTSNSITNNVKESPVSTSYICGSAPIHNHMNTNIFSSYEASIGLITTKNHILVEIDNSKPGRYIPSPLIFTTAKIHTDSKTKVMEPVPILSTIEGNGVKAGAFPGSETKTICLTQTSSDGIKVLSGKPEINALQTYKDNTFSPTVTHSFLKSEALNDNVKKSPTTSSSLKGSTNLFYQDTKLGQSSNTVNFPAAAKLTSSKNTSLKLQPIIDILPTTHTNISIPDEVKSIEMLTCASSSNDISETFSLMDKPKENFRILDEMDYKISLDPLNLQNQENTHKINLESPQHRKTQFISKDSELVINTSVTSNKKLQCQINLSNEATNDSVSKIIKSDTQSLLKEIDNNLSVKTVKVPKQDTKSDFASHDTLPTATKNSSISTSKVITTPSKTEIKTTPSTVPVSTHKVKSTAATGILKPTLSGVCKDVPKSLCKSLATTSQTDIKGSKESTTTSSTPASTASLSNSKLTAISVSAKTDIVSPSSCPSQTIKTDPSIKFTVTTGNITLPSYIVSTSKTKIGSTLTSTTPVITSQAQIQKPLVNIHTTSAFATSSAKTSPSTSAANGTNHANFSKQTKSKAAETIKKDKRA